LAPPLKNLIPLILCGCLILAYLDSRAFVRKGDEQPVEADPPKNEPDPGRRFLWLLVGLAPILIVLITLSSPGPHSSAAGAALLIICPLCNLLGAFGCLGGIKDPGVRIILGIFLAGFFFCLTAVVAVFQACSQSGSI